jgi:hypothetical protein
LKAAPLGPGKKIVYPPEGMLCEVQDKVFEDIEQGRILCTQKGLLSAVLKI